MDQKHSCTQLVERNKYGSLTAPSSRCLSTKVRRICHSPKDCCSVFTQHFAKDNLLPPTSTKNCNFAAKTDIDPKLEAK